MAGKRKNHFEMAGGYGELQRLRIQGMGVLSMLSQCLCLPPAKSSGRFRNDDTTTRPNRRAHVNARWRQGK
jgi:hypothetical protein